MSDKVFEDATKDWLRHGPQRKKADTERRKRETEKATADGVEDNIF